MSEAAPAVDIADVEVIAPNFKRRLSGVTSTIVQLIPVQARTLRIATLGPGLPDGLPAIGGGSLPACCGARAGGRSASGMPGATSR